MCRRILLLAALTGGLAIAGAGRAEGKPPAPFTARDKQTFDDLYQPRIKQAARRKAKAELAKELLAGAGQARGGMKYLLLSATKDLAVTAADLDTAVQAQQQLVELKRGDPNADLRELLGLQLRHFNVLKRKRVPPRDRAALKKELYALGGRIVDNAITLGNAHRGAGDYAAAEEAEKLAENTASLISSPRLTQLRQGIQMSQTLKGLVDQARRYVNLERLAQAQWAYLDAGLYDEAAKLQPAERDETAALVLAAATSKTPSPEIVFEAAKTWDKRSLAAKGSLQQIRLARAAELYRQTLATGKEADRTVAKIRLQAIEKQLGEMLASLKKPTEWVYLVDVKEDSAKVGWGSFGRIRRDKGPLGIAGKNFETGLSVHASSKVVYTLQGQYRQLSICYGLRTGAGGAATFEVVGDGKSLFKSGGMWSNHTHGVRAPLLLNITGVDKLELVTKGLRGGQGAFSAWGDPKVR